eukprot:s292_g24.t1
MESTGRDTPQTKDLSSVVDSPELSQEDVTLYRRITGILMYLATDRPDVQFTVNELASAMSKPTKAALEASKHLTRYLLKTKDYGIYFPSDWDGADDLLVYTDSDWAGDKATRKSKRKIADTLHERRKSNEGSAGMVDVPDVYRGLATTEG